MHSDESGLGQQPTRRINSRPIPAHLTAFHRHLVLSLAASSQRPLCQVVVSFFCIILANLTRPGAMRWWCLHCPPARHRGVKLRHKLVQAGQGFAASEVEFAETSFTILSFRSLHHPCESHKAWGDAVVVLALAARGPQGCTGQTQLV
jgi:hypothetical protein